MKRVGSREREKLRFSAIEYEYTRGRRKKIERNTLSHSSIQLCLVLRRYYFMIYRLEPRLSVHKNETNGTG
jgi:hypothetical protein